MASASAGEVSGPVATMTLDQSAGGRPATSARSMVTRGWASRRAVISAEKGTRSMASALPAGTAWRSAVAMTRPRGGAHLPVQEADGVLLVVVGAEGVGADELGQGVGLVGGGADRGAHLVQDDGDAHLGGLPGGLGAGEAAADDVDRFGHGRGFRARAGEWEGAVSDTS